MPIKALQKITFILLVMLLSSCSVLKPIKTHPMAVYTLNRVSHMKMHKQPTRLTLLVSEPTASAGYESDRMMYRKKRYRLSAFAYHRWTAAPADMLLPLLAQSLRNTNYFRAVVTAPFSGITALRLDTHLLKFEQEFLQSVSQVRMVLQATLVNTTTNKVIASKRFSATVTAQHPTPEAGVIAANSAVSNILQQVAQFSVKYAH